MCSGYTEVYVASATSPPDQMEKRVPITELFELMRPTFRGMTCLNRVQSKMVDVSLKSNKNLLLCVLNGARKTHVDMLSIPHVLGKNWRGASAGDGDGGNAGGTNGGASNFNLATLKIIHIAPMKALFRRLSRTFPSAWRPTASPSVSSLATSASPGRKSAIPR